jgi:EAL domain-containing protein (putative c-di-GMP-specific phosphodiesterase class I)
LRHPVQGLISPADFIPLAEEIGLITKIGEWALHTACQEAASWTRPVSIAVNVSPLQFQNPALVQTVAAALEASGLDPARLELEITEGLLLKDTDETLKMLQALKALGVKITMDDFGTGYSSLSYLQKFPFDKIKIDGSLIRSDNDSTRALISAVTAIGQSLHMNTIAEGVETAEQLAHVKAAGCENVQGFLTGKPESAASATARVNAISNLENRRAN